MKRDRSRLEALSDSQRRGVRDGALTRARQGLRKPMVDLEHEGHRILNLRAGHRGEPQAPAGTQNGAGPGTSRRDGVELMANAINNRLEWERRPKSWGTPAAPAFMPRKKKREGRPEGRQAPTPPGSMRQRKAA